MNGRSEVRIEYAKAALRADSRSLARTHGVSTAGFTLAGAAAEDYKLTWTSVGKETRATLAFVTIDLTRKGAAAHPTWVRSPPDEIPKPPSNVRGVKIRIRTGRKTSRGVTPIDVTPSSEDQRCALVAGFTLPVLLLRFLPPAFGR